MFAKDWTVFSQKCMRLPSNKTAVGVNRCVRSVPHVISHKSELTRVSREFGRERSELVCSCATIKFTELQRKMNS